MKIEMRHKEETSNDNVRFRDLKTSQMVVDTDGWARIKLTDYDYLVTKGDITTVHKRSMWPHSTQGHIKTIKLIAEEIE